MMEMVDMLGVGPQFSDSLDWGPPILNRLVRVLGARFVLQQQEYPTFDLVTILCRGWSRQEKVILDITESRLVTSFCDV